MGHSVADTARIRATVRHFALAGAWNVPVPVLVTSEERVVFANAAALRLLQHPRASEVLGGPLEAIMLPDAIEVQQTRRELIAGTGRPLLRVPTRFLTGDGAEIQQLADVIPLDVQGESLQMFALDPESPDANHPGSPVPGIGPRGPELALAVLEVIPHPILMQDLTTILLANAIAREYLRVDDPDGLLGKPIVSIIHSDGVASALERMVFFFATRQPVRRVPIKLKALDGHAFHADSDAYPLLVDGKLAAMIVGRFLR
jgi:PAS domain-containing protein